MQHIFSCFPWRKVIVYIDDVLVMGDTFEEHLDLVGRVLAVLENHGVKIKMSKCHWFEGSAVFGAHCEQKWIGQASILYGRCG